MSVAVLLDKMERARDTHDEVLFHTNKARLATKMLENLAYDSTGSELSQEAIILLIDVIAEHLGAFKASEEVIHKTLGDARRYLQGVVSRQPAKKSKRGAR